MRNYGIDKDPFQVDIDDVTKSDFRDYIAGDPEITDHSELRYYIETGTKE